MKSEIRNVGIYVSGEISVRSMNTAVYQKFTQEVQNENIQYVDFSGITRADSTCLSLLLILQKHSTRLTIKHLPKTVAHLAALYEVQDWLLI